MTMANHNTEESDDLALQALIDHITDMEPGDRKAAMQELPTIEVQILSELALMYEAYEICTTTREVLAEKGV